MLFSIFSVFPAFEEAKPHFLDMCAKTKVARPPRWLLSLSVPASAFQDMREGRKGGAPPFPVQLPFLLRLRSTGSGPTQEGTLPVVPSSAFRADAGGPCVPGGVPLRQATHTPEDCAAAFNSSRIISSSVLFQSLF